jgi:hypothetical protein
MAQIFWQSQGCLTLPQGLNPFLLSPLPSNLKTQAQLSVDKPASLLTESNKSYDEVNTVSFYTDKCSTSIFYLSSSYKH